MKYYISSGEIRFIVQADSPEEAAIKACNYDWKCSVDNPMHLDTHVVVSEQGLHTSQQMVLGDIAYVTPDILEKAGWDQQ